MSQQPRSRSIDPPAAAEAAPNPAITPPAPSNAPTIFLLILVIGMMGFIAWWAFLSEGARAKANAVLPVSPHLNAVPPRPKPPVAPVPAASAAPDSAVAAARQTFGLRRASSARAAAPNEAAPVISEVRAPAAKRQRQKPVSRAAENDD